MSCVSRGGQRGAGRERGRGRGGGECSFPSRRVSLHFRRQCYRGQQRGDRRARVLPRSAVIPPQPMPSLPPLSGASCSQGATCCRRSRALGQRAAQHDEGGNKQRSRSYLNISYFIKRSAGNVFRCHVKLIYDHPVYPPPVCSRIATTTPYTLLLFAVLG